MRALEDQADARDAIVAPTDPWFRLSVLALFVAVSCAWACAWVLWRLLRPPSPSKPRKQAAPSPGDVRVAPAAAPSTHPRGRQRHHDVRDEAERPESPCIAAAGRHSGQAVEAGDEMKRNDVETVQSTIKRARRLRCRSRSKGNDHGDARTSSQRSRRHSNDPDGDARTARTSYHDVLRHRYQLHSASSATPGPSPRRHPAAAAAEPAQPAPAGLEPVALARAARASSLARTKLFKRMNQASTMLDTPPTPLPFRPGGSERRVPQAGSGAPPKRRTAAPLGSGETTVDWFRSRRLEPSSTSPQTNHDARTDRTASRPATETDCSAARQPGPDVSQHLEVDAGLVLANRYKAAWGMDPVLTLERTVAGLSESALSGFLTDDAPGGSVTGSL